MRPVRGLAIPSRTSIPSRSQFLIYPIPSLDGSIAPGERLFNFVWYRNSSEERLRDLLVDRDGVERDFSLPQGALAERHLVAFRRDAEEILPPSIASVIRRIPEPFLQAIVDVTVPRMAVGRVCRVGDAAFVGRPHAAAGGQRRHPRTPGRLPRRSRRRAVTSLRPCRGGSRDSWRSGGTSLSASGTSVAARSCTTRGYRASGCCSSASTARAPRLRVAGLAPRLRCGPYEPTAAGAACRVSPRACVVARHGGDISRRVTLLSSHFRYESCAIRAHISATLPRVVRGGRAALSGDSMAARRAGPARLARPAAAPQARRPLARHPAMVSCSSRAAGRERLAS